MARYTFHTATVSLSIMDTPVGYSPPRGPRVEFTATYNQRELFQPAVFSYANLGPKWTFDWMSFIEDTPSSPGANVNLYVRGGGREVYGGYSGATQAYAPELTTRAVLKLASSSPIRYERTLPDGSVEVFAQPDGAQTFPRRVFMTAWTDPQGNSATITYDASLRIIAVTDAIGQVTTLAYEDTDARKITRVTDPFGRFASFDYDALGRLERITDVIGIASEFTYTGNGDFIRALTTPYGTTRFFGGLNGAVRWLEAVDPLGGTERLEYSPEVVAMGATEAAVPTGFSSHNSYLQVRNSHYWDKRAMALGPRDITKAKVIHWLLESAVAVASVPASEKLPLENRVWFSYPGQTDPLYFGTHAGAASVGRVLDDGTSQIETFDYNTKGRVCRRVDPVDRETRFSYGTANVADADCVAGSSVDLLKVEQKNGSSWDVLQTATYNAAHQPLTATDAAGQVTTYTYLADGRIQSILTPSRNGHDGNPLTAAERTTAYEYYPDTDATSPFRLKKTTGPSLGGLAGPTSTLTYDTKGRIRTSTDTDSYVLTMDYDEADRLTKVTYPDGTFEETTYNKLDAHGRRDRLGRWSYSFHDALQRALSTRDPAGRVVTQEWCPCGTLDRLLDGNSNPTAWEYDLQGRVKKETRADGKVWEYTYENTTSRLKTVKDAKNQLKTFTYDHDGKLTGIAYTAEVIATPDVTFSYRNAQSQPDPHGHLLTMADGTGTTTYDYHPVGVLGATQLKSVDGPLTADVLEYAYDEMGRVRERKLNGTANQVTYAFDSLGRLRTQGTPVGTFTYAYDGVTARPLSIGYPNGQSVEYAHFDNSGDRRLSQIHNKLPNASTLSKFDYTYDKVGNVATWAQQRTTNPAETYAFSYDAADQLRKGTLTSTAGAVLKTYGYAYDAAGNRTLSAVDASLTTTSYNARNQILAQVAGGALPVAGLLNEPGTVTISSAPASVGADSRFAGQAALGSGTQTFTVTATDATGNARTNTYQVNVTGSAVGPFTHDDNGNLTSDGVKTYEWDAENRLVAVKQGGSTLASLQYDGIGRRDSRTAGGATRTYVWDGATLSEARLSAGGSVRYFDGPGVDEHLAMQAESDTPFYFAADHLRSITDVTTSVGALSATREYDPWGGPLSSSFSGYAFTGREWEEDIQLYYYRTRYYEPGLGRFITEDTIGFEGGTHFYSYASNRPTATRDPFGLVPTINCGKNAHAINVAAGQAEAAVRSGCLPCTENRDQWIRAIRNTTYHCEPGEGPLLWNPFTQAHEVIIELCGGGWNPNGVATGRDLTLFDPAFSPPRCRCLQGVILHEIAHVVTGRDHPDEGLDQIARRCFRCSK